MKDEPVPQTLEQRIDARIKQLEHERAQAIERILAEHPLIQQYNAALGELSALKQPLK